MLSAFCASRKEKAGASRKEKTDFENEKSKSLP